MDMVIAGDYKGSLIDLGGSVRKGHFLKITYHSSIFKPAQKIEINKKTVEAYEVVTDEHRKSATSGIARGLVGSLLGPVGMVAGAMSAKTVSKYRVAIQFKDGKKSLLELDNRSYNVLVESMF